MAQRMRREGVEQSPVDNECNMRATNKSGTQESSEGCFVQMRQ